MRREKKYISDMNEFIDINRHYTLNNRSVIDNLKKMKKMLKAFYFSDEILDLLSQTFVSELEWMILIEHQELSESFMRKHKDEVDWVMIASYQNFSEQFFYDYYLYFSKWVYLVKDNKRLIWKRNKTFKLFLKINGY